MKRTDWIIKYNKENNNEYSNFVFTGKYLAVKKPAHPKARSDGYVYIHQLQAEKKLGRPLKDGECVHHIDENKYNNDIDNLMIFKTIADHTAFHNGCSVYLDNDVYVANKNCEYKLCPICQTNYCYIDSNMCKDCYSEKRKSKIKPDINVLKNLISNYSFVAIGKMFNVSDNTVRKWCKSYGLSYKRYSIK